MKQSRVTHIPFDNRTNKLLQEINSVPHKDLVPDVVYVEFNSNNYIHDMSNRMQTRIDVRWEPNLPFADQLEVIGEGKTYSGTKYIKVRSLKYGEVGMAVAALIDCINKKKISPTGHIEGDFKFHKQGYRYRIVST